MGGEGWMPAKISPFFVAVPHEIAFFYLAAPGSAPFPLWETSLFFNIEKNKTAQLPPQVLSEHFPGVELAHDIRSLQSLPEVRRKKREEGSHLSRPAAGGWKKKAFGEKKLFPSFFSGPK